MGCAKMDFLKKCGMGIAIGAGAILPGISSGVLCVIFGIYEKLLDSILNFFKDIKNSSKLLIPIIIGIAIGVLLFSKILSYFLNTFPIQTKSIFIGLILGTLPKLIKQINEKQKFKLRYLVFTIIAFAIGLITVMLEKQLNIQNLTSVNNIYLVCAGFLMSIGIVVPGVSSTIMLMLLGIYSTYLQSVSNLYFPVLIPMGIGLLIGGIVFMKLTKLLLQKYYGPTFYTIIGFTLGSILVLLPEISSLLEIIICTLCILLGLNIAKCLE